MMSEAQMRAKERWDRIRAYGGTASAKRRVAEEDFQAAQERRNRRMRVADDLREHRQQREMTILEGRRDLALERQRGANQVSQAAETGRWNEAVAKAPYSREAIDFARESDAIAVARERREHERALALDKRLTDREIQKTTLTNAMELQKAEIDAETKRAEAFFKSIEGDKTRATKFKEGMDLLNAANRMKDGNMDPKDLRLLEAQIDRDTATYPTPADKAKAKAALRSYANDPNWVNLFYAEASKTLGEVGYTIPVPKK